MYANQPTSGIANYRTRFISQDAPQKCRRNMMRSIYIYVTYVLNVQDRAASPPRDGEKRVKGPGRVVVDEW